MRLPAGILAALLLSFPAYNLPVAFAQSETESKETAPAKEAAAKSAKPAAPDIAQICGLIASAADKHGIPPNFFARLIWKESRFDHLAVSPVGAQGIAQFMPYTAKERGLTDAFNIELALPASASFLKDLHGSFGNWGLAAAAYNAGPTRLSNWIKNGGFLPLETENYVLSITGKSVDHFSTGQELTDTPLDEKLPFEQACQLLPIMQTRSIPMARLNSFPWAVQVAGNFGKVQSVRSGTGCVNKIRYCLPDVKSIFPASAARWVKEGFMLPALARITVSRQMHSANRSESVAARALFAKTDKFRAFKQRFHFSGTTSHWITGIT